MGAGTNVHVTIVQWAAVATFEAADGRATRRRAARSRRPTSAAPGTSDQTVNLLADPFFQLAPGRSNLRTFGKQQHLLSGIRGPLAVEGGTTSADRSVHAAVVLPGEGNRAPFRVAPQPPEWQQIDTLNVYGDGSMEDLKGNLTSTALTGLNMGGDLDFTYLLFRPASPEPVQRAREVPGRDQLRLDQPRRDHARLHDRTATLSTIEIVNIMLGAGNDHADDRQHAPARRRLQPDHRPARAARAPRRRHGRARRRQRAAHGRRERSLPRRRPRTRRVVQLTRDDGLMWTRYGFQVGQQVTLPNGSSYTITGFKTVNYRRRHDAARRRPDADRSARGRARVSDYLAVTSTFTLSGQRRPALERPGVAEPRLRGRPAVFIPGYGVRTIVGLRERAGPNADGLPRDGAILLVDGSALPAGHAHATISRHEPQPRDRHDDADGLPPRRHGGAREQRRTAPASRSASRSGSPASTTARARSTRSALTERR